VKAIPLKNQSPTLWTGPFQLRGHQRLVRRHDAEYGPWPICEHQYSSNKERHAPREPPGRYPQNEADYREWCLHRSSTFVRGLPLSEKRSIIQTKRRRLFCKADVESRTCEQCPDHESKNSEEH
jgi:hypothetical protein